MTLLLDLTEKTALIPRFHAGSILVDTMRSVLFIDQNGSMSLTLGILVDQCFHGQRGDHGIEGLDGRLFDIHPRHITPFHQFLTNDGIGMALAGNLARCYWFQGKFSEAEQRAQQSLSLLKRYAEPESHHLAVALRLLATVYREQDKNQQAASLYQEALDIHEKLSPPDRLSKAYCLEAFATNDVKQGKYLLAEVRYQEARHLFEDIWGKEHPDVASCLCRLADLYMRFKKYDKVEMYNQQALAIYERFGGSRHPEVNQPLQGLAILYHKVRNDRIEAEQLYKRAISIIEKSQGQYHPDLYAAYSNYAQLLWEKNARNEAEELLQRAEVLKQKMLGH